MPDKPCPRHRDVGSSSPEIQLAMTQRKTTTALLGLEKHTAALDARSLVALDWASFWAHKHTRLRPVPAVVIRRALVCLAEHLSNVDPEHIAAECRAFEDAGKGSGSARSLTEARARIEVHQEAPAAQPMDHWRDALHSKEERAESRRMLEALEKRMEEMQ
jgi:hypothetical protein